MLKDRKIYPIKRQTGYYVSDSYSAAIATDDFAKRFFEERFASDLDRLDEIIRRLNQVQATLQVFGCADPERLGA